MHDVGLALQRIKGMLAMLPAGPLRDQIESFLRRIREKLVAFPAAVAARGPFKNREEAKRALEIEIRPILMEVTVAELSLKALGSTDESD
jgi:hypothetical protein